MIAADFKKFSFCLFFTIPDFSPDDIIAAKWLLAVSWGNLVTYILQGNRYLPAGTSSAVFYYMD